jgi:Cdc6-like AAA superfamily ATPase
MDTRLLILEGLDGTGKTTVASYLIQRFSSGNFPIHYVYFQKLSSEDLTYDHFLELLDVIKHLNGLVIMDRSIISTYAYSLTSTTSSLREFEFARDYDPLIVFLTKVYDTSKLPDQNQRPFIEERYDRALGFISGYLGFHYITTSAETFMRKIKTLEDLQYLLKEHSLPF